MGRTVHDAKPIVGVARPDDKPVFGHATPNIDPERCRDVVSGVVLGPWALPRAAVPEHFTGARSVTAPLDAPSGRAAD